MSTHKLNYQLEQAENSFAARLNIGEVPLVVIKDQPKNQQTHEAKPNLGKNCAIKFHIQEFSQLSC